MEDIHEQYKKAGELHGHYCPGLAIGVRAAVLAKELLNIENIESHGIFCVAENLACYIDGIQALCGCTFGKGNLIYRPTGKTAFSFYNNDNGKSVRLVLKGFPQNMDRPQMAEYILTAPADEVFSIGDVRFPLPEVPGRRPALRCSICGEETSENMLRFRDGKPVCLDCAGLL